MDCKLHRIFVYGTLMTGECNHGLLESRKLEGEGFVRGFNLYNLGYYPGIRPSKHPEHVVHGEVYLVDDPTLVRINELEGEGSLYLLQLADVIMENKTVSARVYVYNHRCKKNSRIYSGCWKQQKIYIAYGSNMNTHQMLEERCPTAKDIGVSYLNGYRLLFRANKNGNIYATIEEDALSTVPVVLWAIDNKCEDTLDRREGWFRNNPANSYYLKKVMSVDFNGESVPGIAYIMTNYGREGRPSEAYLNRILEGYQEHEIYTAKLMELGEMKR